MYFIYYRYQAVEVHIYRILQLFSGKQLSQANQYGGASSTSNKNFEKIQNIPKTFFSSSFLYNNFNKEYLLLYIKECVDIKSPEHRLNIKQKSIHRKHFSTSLIVFVCTTSNIKKYHLKVLHNRFYHSSRYFVLLF